MSAGTVYEVVAGWTGNIDIDLRDDGAVPSGSLSGAAILLVLKDSSGVTLTFTGNCIVQDATNWRVRISPDAADFTAGTYRGRIKVTDSGGKVAYFPNGAYDTWVVHPETF